MTLRILDTFSGIGGFSLAARWLGGFETVQFVERDPYCQRVLAKHWPTVPIHDDICTFNPERGSADVVVGGFPCQDISQAGKQAGIKEGTRSGLFYELIRVVRLVRPQYVVLENVAAIVSIGLDTVLGELAEAGFDAEWACIPASAVGACHRRDRWWCVAYAKSQQRDDLRAVRTGGQAEPKSGNSDGTDVAYPSSTGRRQVATGSSSNESPHERRTAKHDHVAIGVGSQWDGAADPAAHHTIGHRLEGPQRRGPSDAAWPQANLRRLDPNWGGYVSEPVLRRGDDGLSGELDQIGELINEANDSESLSKADQLGREMLRKLWNKLESSTAPPDLRGISSPDSLPVMPRSASCRGGDLGQWTERHQQIHQGLRDLWQDLSGESFQERQNMLKGLSERAGAVERFQALALKSRVDRLRALGNAVVPQVAMVPLARVLQLDEELAS